jgi:hypothetical protein
LAIIFTTVYSADMLLNFFVAYYDPSGGELVTDVRKIAGTYIAPPPPPSPPSPPLLYPLLLLHSLHQHALAFESPGGSVSLGAGVWGEGELVKGTSHWTCATQHAHGCVIYVVYLVVCGVWKEVVLNFFVAYYDLTEGELVTDLAQGSR